MGKAVQNPNNIPICIIHQNMSSFATSLCLKIRKNAMAIQPYMPNCQKLRDKLSAFKVAFSAFSGESFFIGLMEKYWKNTPTRKAKI